MATSLWLFLMGHSAAAEEKKREGREREGAEEGEGGAAVGQPAGAEGEAARAGEADARGSPGACEASTSDGRSFFAEEPRSSRLDTPSPRTTLIHFPPSPVSRRASSEANRSETPSEVGGAAAEPTLESSADRSLTRASEPFAARGSTLASEPFAARGSTLASEPFAARGSTLASEPFAARGSTLASEPFAARGSTLASEPFAARGSTLASELAGAQGSASASASESTPVPGSDPTPVAELASALVSGSTSLAPSRDVSAAPSAPAPCAPPDSQSAPPASARSRWSIRGAIGGAIRATAAGVVVAALDYAIAYRRRQLEASDADADADDAQAAAALGATPGGDAPVPQLSEPDAALDAALAPPALEASQSHRRSPFHGRVSIADWKERLLVAIDDAERAALSYGLPLASSPSRRRRQEVRSARAERGEPERDAPAAGRAELLPALADRASADAAPEEGRHLDHLMASLLDELGRAAGIETDASASLGGVLSSRGRSAEPSRCATPRTPSAASRDASPRAAPFWGLCPESPSPRGASPAPSSAASTPQASPSSVGSAPLASPPSAGSSPPGSPSALPHASASRLSSFGVPLLPLQRSTYVSTYASLTSIPRRLRRHVARWPAERGDERGTGAGREARAASAGAAGSSESPSGAAGGGRHKEGYEEVFVEEPLDVAGALPSPRAPGSMPSLASPSSRSPSREVSPRATSALCSICMDRRPAVEVDSCRHELCFVCARRLCLSADAKLPSCPFCRGHIQGFFPRRRASDETARAGTADRVAT